MSNSKADFEKALNKLTNKYTKLLEELEKRRNEALVPFYNEIDKIEDSFEKESNKLLNEEEKEITELEKEFAEAFPEESHSCPHCGKALDR